MSDEQNISLPPRAQRDMPVHCVKCGAFNDRTSDICSACGAHLRLKCRKCHKSNLRTTSRCIKCHQPLRNAGRDFSVFKLDFKRPRWRRGWLKRRFQRWNRPAALLLIGGLVLWLLLGGARILGIQ